MSFMGQTISSELPSLKNDVLSCIMFETVTDHQRVRFVKLRKRVLNV